MTSLACPGARRVACVVSILLLMALGCAAPAEAQSRPAHSDQLKVCQVGYLPGESKYAVLTGSSSAGEATVRREDNNEVVLRVPLGAAAAEPDSGDSVRLIDFSAVTEPGRYYIQVPSVGESFAFEVGPQAFARAFRLAMRSFTGQRCGTDVNLAPDFPQYRYEACHLDPAHFHSSSGREGTRDLRGGWHDAGDFGRYIVNSGITTGTMLWAYELNPESLRQLNLDLPESGNATPDMLDEIRWNIEWMLKMQDDDGGVWHKSTTAEFPGFLMPADDKEEGPVLIIGSGQAPYKTTEATADFAAVCAIAARVYEPFDAAFAKQCLTAAQNAWAWLQATPDHSFRRNPQGIATGGYGGGEPLDERLWAAAELFRTSGDASANKFFVANYAAEEPVIRHDEPQGWGDVGNLAMYSYALCGRDDADAAAVARIRRDAIAAADQIVQRAASHGYRIPLTSRQYTWGSNSVVANYAMMVLIANRMEPKAEYVNCAQDSLHYLMGRNTFNTSFVTQVGSRWAMNPHHRPSGADLNEQPWPGLLVGGPNGFMGRRRSTTRPATTRLAQGQPATRPVTRPTSWPAMQPATNPARGWIDEQGSFVTNENAINWNAALVFVLAETLP